MTDRQDENQNAGNRIKPDASRNNFTHNFTQVGNSTGGSSQPQNIGI